MVPVLLALVLGSVYFGAYAWLILHWRRRRQESQPDAARTGVK